MDPEEEMTSMDLASLEQAVRRDLEQERGPQAWLRSRSRGFRALLVLGLVAAVAGLTLLVAPRPDLASYPRMRMLATLAWFVLAGGAATWLALQPIHQPRPSPRVVLAVLAVALLGPLVTALLPEVPMAHAPAHRVWPWAYGCFAGGATASVAVLLLARAVDRGGGLGAGQVALAAVAAGLAGSLTLQLHCPINYPLHLLLGHATVPLALVAGTWFARRAS